MWPTKMRQTHRRKKLGNRDFTGEREVVVNRIHGQAKNNRWNRMEFQTGKGEIRVGKLMRGLTYLTKLTRGSGIVYRCSQGIFWKSDKIQRKGQKTPGNSNFSTEAVS